MYTMCVDIWSESWVDDRDLAVIIWSDVDIVEFWFGSKNVVWSNNKQDFC